MDPAQVHPYWNSLLEWLNGHGMDFTPEKVPVQARSSPGAGYGLFAIQPIAASTPLFEIPPKALLNTLTLSPHYPRGSEKLTCTQIVSLHLLLHRPQRSCPSSDPLFGPYISVLPENFDSHPLTWLWNKEHGGNNSGLEAQLVDALPPRILDKLDKMANLYEVDWNVVNSYLQANSALWKRPTLNPLEQEKDYLWAWLNVNTRCVYHRLMKSRSSPDNMTLCPILDFANHTAHAPHTMPKVTNGEMFDTGPLGKKLGEKFTLLAPSTATTAVGEEIYLRYGPHSNATLFSEYGFVMKPDVDEQSEDPLPEELDLQGPIERLFNARGDVGQWMKEFLIAEGYWGDWTLHSVPVPPHPSYRVITTLRLYHLLPSSAEVMPSNIDRLLDQWRDTTLGKRHSISADNERLWRSTLLEICRNQVTEAEVGLRKIRLVKDDEKSARTWFQYAKYCIETLWGEETRVASAVMRSLENDEEF